ncbi:unnamed protein product, partial [Hapterophycus canaliculatus]
VEDAIAGLRRHADIGCPDGARPFAYPRYTTEDGMEDTPGVRGVPERARGLYSADLAVVPAQGRSAEDALVLVRQTPRGQTRGRLPPRPPRPHDRRGRRDPLVGTLWLVLCRV